MMNTLHIWAFREVLRRPLESMLMAAALTLTIWVTGTLLVVPRAMTDTVGMLLDAAPSIVVRRVDAVGWRPMPTQEAMLAVRGVIGVVNARPRTWGAATGPLGPLTVVGVRNDTFPAKIAQNLTITPGKGEVIVGAGVTPDGNAGSLSIDGAGRGTYGIIARMPVKTGIFTHDLVAMNMEDARRILGLPEGYASDLAVDVFHEDEENAIIADLTAAFPWPVRCTTLKQASGVYAADANQVSTLGAMATIPAVLAVCLLVAVNVRKSMGRQRDVGIMKALGWTTGDVVRLQIYRTLLVCLPSAVMGICLSFLTIYWPGATWIGRVFLGWDTLPPTLVLSSKGALTILLEVAAVTLAPVAASALIPAVRGATADVHQLIEGAGDR